MEANSYTSNFKIILLRFLALVVFIAVVLAVVVKIGEVYKRSSNQNEYNAYSEMRFNDFYKIPENTLDMVFVGSSHSYCTFDPENFDRVLPTLSHQLGMPLQHPDATYYTLLEVYRYQNPKVVVMEVYWDMLDDPFVLKQAVSLFLALKNKELEADYIENVFPLSEKLKYYIDIFKYQKDYFLFRSKEIDDYLKENYGITKDTPSVSQTGDEHYSSKGYVYCDFKMLPDEFGRTNQFNGVNGKNWEIDKSQKSYLDRIVRLCNEKGSNLIFVVAPIANVSLEKIVNYEFIHNKLASYARNNDIPFYDYNNPQERPALTDSNFRDDAHLNDSGVKLINYDFIEKVRGYFVDN